MAPNVDMEKLQITSPSRKKNYGTLNLSNLHINSNANLKRCILLGVIISFVIGCSAAAFMIYPTIFTHQQLSVSPTMDFSPPTENATETEFSTEMKFSAHWPTCQTYKCNTYAELLKNTMDLSVDPCDDFYEHVCGNWTHATSHIRFQLDIAHQITEFTLMNSQTSASKSKLVQYMAELYRDFVDIPKRQKFDFAALLKQLFADHQLSLFGTSLPFSNVTYPWKVIESSLDFTNMWKSWKSNPQLWFKPDGDAPDPEQWMDLFVEASLIKVDTLLKSVRISGSEIYINFNEDEVLHDDHLYLTFEELKKKISSFFNIEENSWNSSFDYVLFEMIFFKLELGNIYETADTNFDQTYPLHDLLKDSNSSAHFNWALLLSKFANKTNTSTRFLDDDKFKVVTQNLDLLTSLAKLISSTPIRVLRNMMALHYINELENLKNPNTWRQFLDKDFDVFLPLYTRLFVDYVGRWQMHVSREQANEMMQNLKATFGESLKQEYTWLDDETRKKAFEKMRAFKSMISHPDWILDDTALDEEFGFSYTGTNYSLQSIKGNFADSYLNLLRIVQSGNFRKLDQNEATRNERIWEFQFKNFGANYYESNYMYVTHAILLDPSFDLDYPIELNYGHLGTVLAHEFMHSFDSAGIKHDKDGKENNWWLDAAAKQYANRSQCFVQQYDKVGIDGSFTLDENISDNGGLNLAYKLFEKHLNSSENAFYNSLSPFLTPYSHEQLFFMAYAMNNCFHPKSQFNIVSSDSHSRPKYRVNIPLKNSQRFAQAFNCPVGSRMNPKQKCMLW